MAKLGTILSSDKHLLEDALIALGKNKLMVVQDHINKVLENMKRADSYSMPQKSG